MTEDVKSYLSLVAFKLHIMCIMHIFNFLTGLHFHRPVQNCGYSYDKDFLY